MFAPPPLSCFFAASNNSMGDLLNQPLEKGLFICESSQHKRVNLTIDKSIRIIAPRAKDEKNYKCPLKVVIFLAPQVP